MKARSVYDSYHDMFRTDVRKFLETEAIPHLEAWEAQGHVDRSIWEKAGELGFLCPTMPEELGGVGGDFRFNSVIDEEIYRAGLTGIGFGLHSDIAAPYILHYGSETQKETYLPAMARGEKIAAIAMTEPGTGSDLQGIKTNAVLKNGRWILNGSKTFITNGYMADVVIVVAKTDPEAGSKGFSLFLVDADTAGFEKGQPLKKVGMKAQDTCELFFNDCSLDETQLLGERGQGLRYLMQELPQERLSVAVGAVAHARSLVDQTLAYAKERNAFGKPIAAFQNTQFKLAELDSEVTMMQVFIDQCLAWHVEGELDAVMAAKAKYLSTDLQCKVADECVQLHGGYGYMWEYPVARGWADARVQRIYAGTNEIMKLIISRDLLERS
ncbi:acyl-CoA dehydrogenase family protein [Reinekea blandensis]|uniref:Probable acyl-CoA dehydrogenase n=1 Tax=Reinekea blandensis MED297 TaxID=314283 RepID=A4BGI4_9GAMM|nr:acyl-CoA dehydrogenase family protein [Reinekea blandensis]EAR08790.1 probable acyl-CoA dehydrogenase [Reinekea sp. MED297] [Reinekea blandensis MED297]